MSDGMNKVLLLGNLGADPELKRTAAGQPYLKLRLATNESWIDKDQKAQERVEWHSVTVWGARAEGLARILTKGSSVLVEGGLRTTTYDKEGQKHYRTEIHARDVFLTGRRPSTQAPARAASEDPIEEQDATATNRLRATGTSIRRAPAIDELPF